MTDLLVAKDNELKRTLKKGAEQAQIDLKMEALKAEVEKQDQDIQQLQRQLKEAEQILATAIYQAKQKLQSIAKANKRTVPSEELIKFAHRISASNAVCAPLTWQQGDPRRPYPTGKNSANNLHSNSLRVCSANLNSLRIQMRVQNFQIQF